MKKSWKTRANIAIATTGVLLFSALPAQAVTSLEDSATSKNSEILQAVSKEGDLTIKQAEVLHEEVEKGSLSLWVNGEKVEPYQFNTAARGYQAKTWAACHSNWSKDVQKTVRVLVPTTPIRNNVVLRCGTSGWGYRHMLGADQQKRWAPLAAMVGANWRDFVDFTMETTVKNPYRVSPRPSNGTINIRGIVQLKKYDGKTIYTNYPDIAADARDGRVITVIPKSTK